MQVGDRAIAAQPRHSPALTEGRPPRLTARQRETLLHCVRAGYYDIPRRVTLRQAAAGVGISATSLSLLLRRAERELVQAFAKVAGEQDDTAAGMEPRTGLAIVPPPRHSSPDPTAAKRI